MLFNNKKEWDTDTCYYMGEIWKHYTNWMKLFTKDNIFYDSIKKNVQNNQICRERKYIWCCHWIKEKAREFQKNIYCCFTDYTKAFDCVDHNKL